MGLCLKTTLCLTIVIDHVSQIIRSLFLFVRNLEHHKRLNIICFFSMFSFQAQKPWSKRLTKVLKCKKDYHIACKLEKTAANQENNARNSSDVSADQVTLHRYYSGG